MQRFSLHWHIVETPVFIEHTMHWFCAEQNLKEVTALLTIILIASFPSPGIPSSPPWHVSATTRWRRHTDQCWIHVPATPMSFLFTNIYNTQPNPRKQSNMHYGSNLMEKSYWKEFVLQWWVCIFFYTPKCLFPSYSTCPSVLTDWSDESA